MELSDLFKNFGDLKGKMEEARRRMARLQVTGESGAGMVRVTVNGEGHVTDIKIDRAAIGPSDNELLEELILSAVNDGLKKAREAVAHEMRSMTGGLSIPGIEKLFGMQ